MGLRWPLWGRRRRDHDTSTRPRVALAVQAARAAHAAPIALARRGWSVWDAELGLPVADVTAGRPRMELARAEAGRIEAIRAEAARARAPRSRQRAGLSPSLLRATAQAARASGREPAEVWAEALAGWLARREEDAAAAEQVARLASDGRRVRAWQMIDATLGELRAS